MWSGGGKRLLQGSRGAVERNYTSKPAALQALGPVLCNFLVCQSLAVSLKTTLTMLRIVHTIPRVSGWVPAASTAPRYSHSV